MPDLTQDLVTLDDFLMSDAVAESGMMLSEVNGFLAGVIVCPEVIPPSEWLTLIWGDEDPVFESQDQAERIFGVLMAHYNDTIAQLDEDRFSPIYDMDTDDTPLWEIWLEGFIQAMGLRPDAWNSYVEAHEDDEDLQFSIFVLSRLAELSFSEEPVESMEMDDDLLEAAADLLPQHVQALHSTRVEHEKAAAGKH